jgi:hypothetical protein
LNIVVANDLYAIAPWIKKVEKRGQWLDTGVNQRLADLILVIDYKSKMASLIGGLARGGSALMLQFRE